MPITVRFLFEVQHVLCTCSRCRAAAYTQAKMNDRCVNERLQAHRSTASKKQLGGGLLFHFWWCASFIKSSVVVVVVKCVCFRVVHHVMPWHILLSGGVRNERLAREMKGEREDGGSEAQGSQKVMEARPLQQYFQGRE